MSFPDRIVPGRVEDPHAIQQVAGPKVLQDSRVSHMLQVVAQLIDVRKFAQEMFEDLQISAMKTSQRIQSVGQRVHKIQQQVPIIEEMFHRHSPASFVNSPMKHPLKRTTNTKGGFFIRSGAPHAVDRRRDVAQKWPDLNKLNRFQKCLDTKTENLFCLDKYTNPRFFFDMWLKGEQERLQREKAARKKRRKAKGKRKKNKGSKKTTVQKVKRKRFDEFGNAYYVEVGANTETEEYMINVTEGTANTLTYGTAVEYNNITHHTSTSGQGDVYQPAAYNPQHPQPQLMPHQQPPPNLQKGPGSIDPPSMGSFNPPPGNPISRSPPVHPPAPNRVQELHPPSVNTSTAQVVQGSSRPPAHHPPPGPRQPMHQPPSQQPYQHQPQPQQQAYRPPQPMAQAPPAQPQQPAIPDCLAPYSRMKKMRVPVPGIKNKMRQNGIDPALFDQYLADGAPGGAAPPQQPAGSRPPPGPSRGAPGPSRGAPGPSRGAPGPRGGLLGAIRQGASLNSAAARQMAPPPAKTGHGGLLDGIRGGIKLASANARKLKPRKVELNVRDATLNAITRGVKLKKAEKTATRQEAQEDANSIFALMKMRDLIKDSDSEDDSEEWSD